MRRMQGTPFIAKPRCPAPFDMGGTHPLLSRPVHILVPVLGLLYVGLLVLVISSFESPPTSASNPYPIIADGLAVVELVAAFLIWRGLRIGYVVAAVMSVVFLVLFSGDLQDGLTAFADVPIFLQTITLVSVLVLVLVYSILNVRLAWRKTTPTVPTKTVPVSTTLAVLAVGFIVGAAFIGILAAGVESRLLANSGTRADVTIVQGASSHYPNGPFFSPANLTVKVGKTVTWVNKDTVTHTVTSDGSVLFDSGFMPTGSTFQFTFTMSGTFPYYCTVHPYMKGTIVVTA
jgi:plastocyanin